MEPLGATTVFLVICVSCLLFLSARRKTPGSGKLPPGPVAFPLIGNMLQLNAKNMPQELEQLSRTYGPIFTIYLGSERVVVLHGYEAVKEALVDLAEAFGARGSIPLFDKTGKGTGIALTNGEQWKELRRFALTTLRNYGMGKKSVEERIQEETRFLVERLRNTQGRPYDTSLLLIHVVANVICAIVFGDRFDYEDENFVTLISLILENGKLPQSLWAVLYTFFPTLMDYVPGPHQKIFQNVLKLRRFVQERVKMHRESLDPNCPRDFIDAFLIKMDEERMNSQSHFKMGTLCQCAVELFMAGTGTTSTTLNYGLLILLKYPEIQEKVQEEIDRVIGQSRSPSMADRSRMPYTDAVIHEIHRFITLIPLGSSRAVTRDVHLRQFLIPKGTTIYPVLRSVLHDSREFPNPEQFNPGHFLDANGAFKKSDFFMPFSAGKRVCLGEGLAPMGLFLVLTAILQHFTLKPVVDPNDLDITPVSSFVSNEHKPFQLCALPRERQ
nr:cytochrome P450 2H2-like [Pelodiscus sinensis]|eukprot:XP_014425549.1 cytochrome P450 2H2-like [Pelodiscus sinensis]